MTEPPRQKTPPDGPEHAPPPWWDEFEAASASAGLGGNGGAGDYGSGYSPPRGLPDLSPLFALIDALRRVVPAELQEQWTTFQRELLLLVRSLIDWYLERLESGPRAPEVEEIPID
jgi:hypothetical protein